MMHTCDSHTCDRAKDPVVDDHAEGMHWVIVEGLVETQVPQPVENRQRTHM
jgi:hypothetical protein